jgi:hypothetical protein
MATYLLNILSAIELKKPVSKRVVKNLSLVLLSLEPWETMEAQLLVKIDTALKPKTLNLNDYNIMFHIPRLLLKLGMTLTVREATATVVIHCVAVPSQVFPRVLLVSPVVTRLP